MSEDLENLRAEYEALNKKYDEVVSQLAELTSERDDLTNKMIAMSDKKEDYTVRVYAEICIDMGVRAFDEETAISVAKEAVLDWSFEEWSGFSSKEPTRAEVIWKGEGYDESMDIGKLYLPNPNAAEEDN